MTVENSWITIEEGVAKKISTPIIYFNPTHKKIFFNAPYPFLNEDRILIQISLDKQYLLFTRLPNMVTSEYNKSFKLTEFAHKRRASLTAPQLFKEFPGLFKESNKYQSMVFEEIPEEEIAPFKLIIDLEAPMNIKRKVKKQEQIPLEFKNDKLEIVDANVDDGTEDNVSTASSGGA